MTDLASYRVYYGTSNPPCPGSSFFQVASSTPSPAPNQTETFRLTGLSPGTLYYGSITAVDTSGNESACLTPASAVARIDFAVSPTGTVNFGNLSLGSFADQTFTVQNTVGGTVSGTASISAPFSIVSGSPFTLVGVGASQAVTVRFTPTIPTTAMANVNFTADGDTISVIVTGSATDTTPPTISMTAPAAGATLAGTVTASASATDNVGVAGVQFKLDGANLGAEVTAAPYSTSWNTTLAANGSHTLTAVARDAAGNTATAAAVNVTVSNAAPDITPPSVPSNLSASAVSSSQINLSWTASTDNVGVAGYKVFRCQGLGCSPSVQVATATTNSYSDTGLSPSTTYVYQVSAFDAAGNVSALSAAASAATLATPPADISSGLGLYYRFDEGSGSLANDSSGNGNTGSLLGGTTWTAGKLGQAVSFDGVSGSVTASTTTGLNLSATLTIAAWINPSDLSAPYRTLVAKGAAGLRGYGVNLINGKLNFIKVNGPDVTSSVAISTGAWQHVAITWNAATSEVKFYLNGALAQTIINSSVPSAPLDTDKLLVSLWLNGGSYFAGAMDELRIYNRVLSATDILALYNVSAPPPDTTPPTVSITAPVAGTTVSGTVTVSATASDNVGVVGVQFKLDGANLGAERTTAPYTLSWTTATASNAAHTLTAVARDAAGNTATAAPVSVTVNNTPPTVSMTAPAAGAMIAGTVTVSASASSTLGIAGVQFQLDGANLGAEVTVAPYALSWTTTTASNATHSLTAVARDTAGNRATATAVNVTVDNIPPAVSITAPAAGATVSGTITVSASATDNVGVAGVQFKLDSANLGAEVVAAPYSTSWNTTLAANGSHILTAVARDAAGNTATSTAVSVTVSNFVPDTTPPSVPTNLSASAVSSSQINLSWTASTDNVGVAGYQIYRGASQIAATSLTSYADTGLSPSTVYTYKVAAYDAAGNVSAQSAAASAVTLALPSLSPVAAYGFNEGSGSVTADASSNSNTGTLNGATWTTAGKYGNALFFNGTSSYVEAADIDALTPGTGATFEAWVFLTSAPTELASVFNKWNQTIDDEYLLGINPNRTLFFAWQTTGGYTFGTPSFNGASGKGKVPLNTWTHIAVVRSGATISFYINGGLDRSVNAADTNPFRNGINSLRIGGQNRGGKNRFFNGTIDEVRAYNRALALKEIQNDMNSAIGVP